MFSDMFFVYSQSTQPTFVLLKILDTGIISQPSPIRKTSEVKVILRPTNAQIGANGKWESGEEKRIENTNLIATSRDKFEKGDRDLENVWASWDYETDGFIELRL